MNHRYVCGVTLRVGWHGRLEDINQPVVDAAEDGVSCGVRAVDGDVVLGQAQDDALVGVVEGDGFEAAEDEGV